MKKTIYILALAALSLTACNNEKKQMETKDEHSKEIHKDADSEHVDSLATDESSIKAATQINESITEIYDGYLQIKNALVADSKDGAALGAKALLVAFDNFDMAKLTESQHKEYMEILENAKEHAEHIVKSPIDHQREHFEELSTDINDLMTLLGNDKTL